jgi:hypothetical protein
VFLIHVSSCVQFGFNFTVVVFRFVDENRIQESVRQRFFEPKSIWHSYNQLCIRSSFRRNLDDITEKKRIAKTSATAYKLHNYSQIVCFLQYCASLQYLDIPGLTVVLFPE